MSRHAPHLNPISLKPHLHLALMAALSVAFALPDDLKAASLETTSNIAAVTVYPDGALVTRAAIVQVPAGEHKLTIRGLPQRLIESSLRVSGQASSDIKLGSIELRKRIARDSVNPQEKALRKELDKLFEQKQVATDKLQADQDQLSYIRAMAAPGGNKNQSSTYLQLPIDQWESAWKTLQSATEKTQERLRKTQQNIADLDKSIQQRQKQLKQIATHQKSTRVATLHLDSAANTELQLELRYQIQGARWQPVYDADLDTESNELTFTSLAQISQRTGEDWKDIDLVVSTLRPSAGTQLPNLEPWVIDFKPKQWRTPPMSKAMRSMPEAEMAAVNNAPQLTEAEDQTFQAPAPVLMMQHDTGTLALTSFSAEYQIPGKISVTSGSDRRRVTLRSESLETTILLASVPRLDPRAMILTKTLYKNSTPLLPGNAVLYRDGSFVGNTHLSMHQGGDDLELAFGEDDRVNIEFIPDPDHKSREGILFGKRKKITRNYQFRVTSEHETPYEIQLSDKIPVAADSEIKITMTGDKPTHSDLDGKQGIHLWERTLKPAEAVQLEYGYEVSFPKDKRVFGL